MKRRVLGAAIVCVLALGVTAFAEKKNIVVKNYSSVLVNATNNYQVNGQGDIVTYSFSKDDTGVITAIYFTYTKKSGTDVLGQIGPGTKITDNFLPANSVSFEIVGLERNDALCLFTNNLGSRIYMVFRLVNKYATPTPNRTNPVSHVALTNELCSITNNQVLSYLHIPESVNTVTFRRRFANIAELTTPPDNTLSIGDRVTIIGVPDDSYNLTDVEVLSVSATTFTYSCPGLDEASVATTGFVYRPEVYNSLTVYNHNWSPQASKGIANDYGALSIINLKIQQYYKGVKPTAIADQFDVTILKP